MNSNFLSNLSPWLRNFLTFIVGAASVLAQAPYDISLILFITLPLFILLMDGDTHDQPNWSKKSLWTAFKRGWWFGFGYLLASLWWIGAAFLVEVDHFIYFMPFAVIALPMALAIYYGIGAMIARAFWGKNYLAPLALAFGFGICEYLRGTLFTGFPWNALGYGAMPSPLWMQSVSLIGFYSLNALAILVFSSPALLFRKAPLGKSSIIFLCLSFGLFVSHFTYGYLHYDHDKLTTMDSPMVKVVQPNIAQRDKWDPAKKNQNFNKLLDVTLNDKTPAKIIIWPESTFPFYLQETFDAQTMIGDIIPQGTTLIAGGLRYERNSNPANYHTYNSLLVINDKGEIIDQSDKTHLLPFGEFLPFQDFLESLGVRQFTQLPGGFSHGRERNIIKMEGFPAFLPLICYEVIFPNQLIPENTGQRPKWIINITNDGWFGDTPAPHQHLRQTQIRAVEERLAIFRSANSGISAVINPLGEVTKFIGLNQTGTINNKIEVYSDIVNNLSKNTLFLLLIFLILLSLRYGTYKN